MGWWINRRAECRPARKDPEEELLCVPLKDFLVFIPVKPSEPLVSSKPQYEPSPEEIAKECQRIQEGWSDCTREARETVHGRVEWKVPVIDLESE